MSDIHIELISIMKRILEEQKLNKLYSSFLIDHTDFSDGTYHKIISRYIGHRIFPECTTITFFDTQAEKLIALRDKNGFLPEDLQTLFNEWLLKRL